MTLQRLSARLSISERVRGLAGGAIDTGSISFFVVVGVVCLTLARFAVARQRAGRHRRGLAVTLGVVALALVAQSVVDDHGRLIDLTSGRTLSLSSQTTQVVRALPSRVQISAFVATDQPGRVEAVALLDRYQWASRKVRARVLDPLERPGEMRRLGIDPLVGGVALEMDDRIEHAAAVTEQDVTLALARLERGELPRLCLATGHGETDPTSTLGNGLSRAVSVLTGNGYEVGTIDLLATPSVPAICGAVLLVGPTAPLGSGGEALRRWYDADGRLLVLAESGLGDAVDGDLDRLLDGTGVTLAGGVVAEGDPASVIQGDPTAPIIRRYGSGNPVVRNLPPVFLVGAGGIDIADGTRPGRTVNRLADTSGSSLLVDDPRAVRATGRPGPITVMAAVDESANAGAVPRRRRLVVVSDADFATNAFVDQAGNARLLVQAADWLTVDESLVSITSDLAAPRPLELTAARRQYALLLSAGILPGLLLVAGGLVWALRRNA